MGNNSVNNIKSRLLKVANNLGETSKNVLVTVKDTVADNSNKITEQVTQYIDEKNLKKYSPIFKEDILKENFLSPQIIQIIDYDKRLQNKVCKNSIGFETKTNSVRALSVYSEYVDLLDKRFYPNKSVGTYYVDPCIPDLYIDVNEFFSYMKKARVDELGSVAQMLGAKHFKIELKIQNENQDLSNKRISSGLKKVMAGASYQSENLSKTSISVAAECNFTGNDTPKIPSLLYFKDDSNIKSLIEMRTDCNRNNSLVSKSYAIEYNKSSGIRFDQTADIGTTLKNINCNIAENFERVAKEESRTILQYTIDF